MSPIVTLIFVTLAIGALAAIGTRDGGCFGAAVFLAFLMGLGYFLWR